MFLVTRKKVYRSIEELQGDLDSWITEYNEARPYQVTHTPHSLQPYVMQFTVAGGGRPEVLPASLGRGPDPGAQMLGIGGDRQRGVGRRFEQEIVDAHARGVGYSPSPAAVPQAPGG